MTATGFFKKALLCALLIMLIVQFTSTGAFAAPSKPDIDIEVEAGFNGVARMDSKIPFRITLRNRGAAFNGEVQVLQPYRDYNSVQVYAMPCSLPKGSEKELVMYVPVTTAKRDIKISLAKGNKVVKTINYRFNRTLPPYTPVVGIISDDESLERNFGGIMINRTYQAAVDPPGNTLLPRSKEITNEDYSDQDSWATRIDEKSIPDTLDGFSQFDVILISNFDTGRLTDQQFEALSEWVDYGGILLIAGGPGWRKTFGGLPGYLKPAVTASEIRKVGTGFVANFSDKEPPAGETDIIPIDPGQGTALAEESGYPMIVSCSKGDGAVAYLAFDPGLEPIVHWSGAKSMWQSVIQQIYGTTALGRIDQTFGSQYLSNINFSYLASSVPDGRTPPFKMLIVLIGAYIIIVSPILYLFLKWRDKRDLSWVAVPAVALAFLGIIYLAGFKFRYNTAVLNNFSFIRLNFENNRIDADSFIGIFNNRKDKLEIAYDPGLMLDLSSDERAMVSGRFYAPGYDTEDADVQVTGKFILTNPPVWEFYDTMLWEPKLVTVKKSGSLSGGLIEKLTLEDKSLSVTINNTTGMNYEEAFFAIGNIYIDLGNISENEKKTLNISLDGPEVSKSLSDFLDKRYGPQYNSVPRSDLPKNWRELNRKRNILDYVLVNTGIINSADPDIRFYAFNYDDPGYDITVNSKKPVVLNTNLVYSRFALTSERGSRISIPAGIVRPAMVQGTNAFYDDVMEGTIRVQSGGDVNFRFRFPKGIRVDRLVIKWPAPLPTYYRYIREVPKGDSGQEIATPEITEDKYRYYIYNVEKGEWEETGREKTLTGDLSRYVDSLGDVELKVSVTVNDKNIYDELLRVPDIEISGEVE